MRYFINKQSKHYVEWNAHNPPHSKDVLLATMQADGYTEVSFLRFWFYAIFKI